MKLVTRTALAYALLTAAILFVFAYSVYFVSEKNRKDEFFDRLDYKIIWRAEFIFDAHINKDLIRILHRKNQTVLNEADISVYDSNFNLYFSDNTPPLGNLKQLQVIKKNTFLNWSDQKYQYRGIVYRNKNEDFYIIGKAVDVTGLNHISAFKENVLYVYIGSIAVIFIIGFGFSYYTLKPLKEIIFQIRDISEHNLNKRIVVPKAKDELYELTQTFNATFNRLEQSFNNHRNFVTTISHEFRTPLSILIAEIELGKELNQTIDDYKISLDNALEEANHVSQLSTALLDFARANYDVSQIKMSHLRIDEVLVEAKLNLLNRKDINYKIGVSYADSDETDANSYDYLGNPYLLQAAFSNIIENACKYSDNHSCHININASEDAVTLKFLDNGIGIPKEDLEKIYGLFYRGKNKNHEKGYGIGLSIVKQIISLHNGSIDVTSVVGKGTVFTVVLPINNNL
ncbi:HAMP domain-containing sensor histidine kinase [Flavobacterium sp. DG1-102-2]|uniref:HAMP domain-containing sensor histidine kinase n=1 Tax=Flavobacterium sp. DG1-102-2 TaxID=3081663 RepID=UPI00294A1C5F|nr:HAMP domain-containing sensor histidine kinase [Flavobacterium sp. DG1-102-2]MDV6168221.1 HAMP domain-containing sensor histidine kinase [Flavobacterium sp. DG1-102-2]